MLIDADVFMNELNESQQEFDEYYKGLGKAKTLLLSQPAVDAQPVVHGHKVIHNRPYAAQYIYVGDDGYGNLVKRTDYSGTRIEITPAILSNPIEYCSECGKRMDGIWQNYCDNCGAKMENGDK